MASNSVRHFRIIGLAGVALLLAGCGSTAAVGSPATSGTAGTARQAPAAHAVVSTRSLPGIGTVLVNQSGQTIYSPQQKIVCTGSCLGFWFPVTVAPGTALRGSAGVTGVLSTIHRGDNGLTQLTYDGKPLYTFRLDQVPGQARGNDYTDHFGGATFTWHAVTTAGTSAEPSPAAPSGSASGYSYPAGSGY
jgi:predicted lipoprotein with Yx(FWY)xxD motif